MVWSTGRGLVVSTAKYDWHDPFVHDVEELLCDVVDADGVLEGEVEVVISLSHFPARGLVGPVALELAATAVDVDLNIGACIASLEGGKLP